MRKIMLTVLAGTALTLAACGSDNKSTADPYNPPATVAGTTPAPSTTLAVKTSNSLLGQILVDPSGRTLYAFTQDVDSKSSCTGACAATWPPELVKGDIAVDNGLSAKLFSAVDRPDGAKQLRVGKWPLYTFAGDAAPGDTNGQGSGGFWFVVGTDGSLVGN
jgi:predicted lipoprotein with Yx(FWY)xxD motif